LRASRLYQILTERKMVKNINLWCFFRF
jgi:hypothetical protein